MSIKIAILADCHGNATALKAVINDALKQGAQEFWSLGDIAFGGPRSEKCYQLLEDINTTQYLLGNWETAFNQLMKKKDTNLDDPSNVYFATLASYDYSHFSKKRIKQIKTLPLTGQKVINGFNFSLSHNLPSKNRGHQLVPRQKQENFDKLAENQKIDVAIYAHIHSPLWRYTSTGQMILNPGSVGQRWFDRPHLLKNRKASYLLLKISKNSIDDVDFRRISYNIAKEIQKAKELNFPYVNLYKKSLLTGYSPTHNTKVLKQVNKIHDYQKGVKNFLRNLK